MAPKVNPANRIERALDRLRMESALGTTNRDLGAILKVGHSTVGRWISGDRKPTGKSLTRLVEWAERHQAAPTPVGLTAGDAKGMRYAAEAMAAALSNILREARELEAASSETDKDAARYQTSVRQSASAKSATPQRKAAQ